jgi:hypothetical protein
VVGQVRNQEELVGILNCSISSLLLKDSGLPLGAPFKSKAICDGVVEKMEKRLASWKKIYLSRGSCLTLIKSTLSILAMYLSLFHLLAGIAKRLESIQRDFLWNGFDGERKLHLVKWKTVCSPIPRGGLGVKNLMFFNKALRVNGFGDTHNKRIPYGDR